MSPLEILVSGSLDVFASDFWGKRSRLVRRGRDAIAPLLPPDFSFETLKAALDEAGTSAEVLAYAVTEKGDVDHIPAVGLVGHALRMAGHTLFLNNCAAIFPHFAGLEETLQRELGYPGPVQTKIFFGGADSSLGLHFDTFSVFSVQCEGKKLWRYEEAPTLACPRATASGAPQRARFAHEHPWRVVTPPAGMTEVILEPGDILYVPAGAWHCTESVGGDALSISISFPPLGFDQLIAPALRRALDTFAWRQNFPISTDSASLHAFVRARLDEAAKVLSQMAPEEFLASVLADDTRAPAPVSPRAVQPSDHLVLNRRVDGVVATLDPGGKETVCVHAAETELVFPATCLPFFKELVERRGFVAKDAIAWFAPDAGVAWESVAPVLELLVQHGVLLPAQ